MTDKKEEKTKAVNDLLKAFAKDVMADENTKCEFCGWRKKDHRDGQCYHYSDETNDYFYSDREFTLKKS